MSKLTWDSLFEISKEILYIADNSDGYYSKIENIMKYLEDQGVVEIVEDEDGEN